MSILGLLLVIAVIGLIAWALITYIPMPAGVRTVILIVAVVCAVIYALNAFGVHLPNPPVPQVH
jgi:hypothetical protein